MINTNDNHFISDYMLNKVYNEIQKNKDVHGVELYDNIKAFCGSWCTFINSLGALQRHFNISENKTINLVINANNAYKNELLNIKINLIEDLKHE